MLKAKTLTVQETQLLGRVIPGPEPMLRPCSVGPRAGGSYPVAESSMTERERRYLNECIDTNWISSRGEFPARFEKAFAQKIGVETAISCANGTVALHLVLSALGIGPGDEVIVPTFSMIATANAVTYTGATPIPVDAEFDYCNLDPILVEQAISPRTKAIIVVHTYGHPAELEALEMIAKRHGIALIEDAAEAHGAEFAGKKIGSFGTASTFSFYANKILTTGEGGMICTNDGALASVIRRLRDHAFSPERHFWHEYVGFNYRMTNMQAAVGLAQTERFDELVAARRNLRRFYDEALKDVKYLELPREAEHCKSVFWMYALRVTDDTPCSRDELRVKLASAGIETRSFFTPIHCQPIYRQLAFRGDFPVSENLCTIGLYLPTSACLTQEDAHWIAGQVRQAMTVR